MANNLLDKASIILTPTAYNNGEALCVKPSDGSGDFDFSRNSAATRVNAQGLVENVQILSSNLVVNGDFSDGENNWSFAGDWELVNGTAEIQSSTTSFLSQVNVVDLSVKNYRLQYEVVTTNGSNFRITGGSSAFGTVILDSATIGVKTIDLTSNGTQHRLIFTQSAFRGSIDNISLIEITDDTNLPRINYESGCGSWLFEPQSTNLITYSEDFSQSYWTKQAGITATYNTTETLSPDGTYNATKFVGNGTTGVLKTSISVSGVVSRSVYLKSVTGITTATFKEPNTNVPSPITLTITNEWQRFEMIGDNGSSFQGLQIDDITSDGIYMWGAQAEALSYATSYIPTEGSTVTRNQDVCTNGGSLASINSTEGVLYAEIAALDDDLTQRNIAISDGSNSNLVRITYHTTSNSIRGQVRKGGSITASLTHTVTDITDFYKVAISYKENDVKLYINGVQVATDTDATMPTGLNQLSFDRGDGTLNFYGKTKMVAVFPYLTDEEMINLTT